MADKRWDTCYSVPSALVEARRCLDEAKTELTWAVQHGGETGEERREVRHWTREVATLEQAARRGIHVAKRR